MALDRLTRITTSGIGDGVILTNPTIVGAASGDVTGDVTGEINSVLQEAMARIEVLESRLNAAGIAT